MTTIRERVRHAQALYGDFTPEKIIESALLNSVFSTGVASATLSWAQVKKIGVSTLQSICDREGLILVKRDVLEPEGWEAYIYVTTD